MNIKADSNAGRPQRQDIQPSHLNFPVVGIRASATQCLSGGSYLPESCNVISAYACSVQWSH